MEDYIEIKGARVNNLKNINVKIPRNKLVVFTGVSGSGKSSLLNGVIYPYLANNLNRAKLNLGNFEKIEGIDILRFTDYGKTLKFIVAENVKSLSVDTQKDLDKVTEIIANGVKQ